MLQNLPPQEVSDSWDGEMTMENTLGDMVGLSILSAEVCESKGFHLVLPDDPELGVLRFLTPEPECELPELGVFSFVPLGVL